MGFFYITQTLHYFCSNRFFMIMLPIFKILDKKVLENLRLLYTYISNVINFEYILYTNIAYSFLVSALTLIRDEVIQRRKARGLTKVATYRCW